MTVYIITDTHFGHKNLYTKHKCRPEDFSDTLYEAWKTQVTDEDTIIHLGDISFDKKWLAKIADLPGRKILVKGNHDTKPDSWYLEHGWTFVCESYSKTIDGLNVVFSHEPMVQHPYDINIHGHLHHIRSIPTISPCYHMSLELDWGFTRIPTLDEVVVCAAAQLEMNKKEGDI